MMLSARIAAVEFDEREVRLAVVKTGGRLPALLECHSEPIAYGDAADRDEACAEAVRNILGRVKQKPSAAVLCASSREAVVRAITIPFKGARRVTAAVRFELEPYLVFPIDDLVVQHSVIREIDGSTQVLAVGLNRAQLEKRIAWLNGAGTDPDGICLDGSGLTALWQASRKNAPGLHAVLHVREQGSILAVIWNKTLAYMRHLPVTLAQMHENPAAAARDAQNSLRAFQGAWEGEAELDGLSVTGVRFFEEERQLFEEAFRVPVSYDELAPSVKGMSRCLETDTAELPEGNRWETLAGVAQASVSNLPYGYNFRSGELAQPHAFGSMLRHAAFSLVIGSIALAGYGFYMYLDYSENNAKIEAARGEMWEIFTQAFPGSSRAGEQPPASADAGGATTFQFMNEELANAEASGKGISMDVFKQPTPLDILAEVAKVMPVDKVTLTKVDMTPQMAGGAPKVTIAGTADNPEVFSQLFQGLSQSKILHVDPDPTRESEGTKLKFTITATLEGTDSAKA